MVEISDFGVRRKGKRLRSAVWNDFKKIKKNGKIVAVCNGCTREFVGHSGTTHLKKHLLRCTKRPFVDTGDQLLLASEEHKDETPPVWTPRPTKIHVDVKFDQERSQFDLARMIILHDYPFSIAEHNGFTTFVNNLQPLFKMVPTNAVKADCLTIFEQEKEKLYEALDKLPGRISLTINMWASYQNVVFLCLTAQYIDEDWNVQKKILNFVMVDPLYNGETLSEVIMRCLLDWNIFHKLFALTAENSLINDDVISRIRSLLTQKRMLVSDGMLFHVQCVTHFRSLIAQDGLEMISEVVDKVRESVKFVKSSQAREQKFIEATDQLHVHSERSICIDVPAQWNSTYLMLEVALEYKDVFSYLHKHDAGYHMIPNAREWEVASLICNHLKVLYEVGNDFLGAKYPTANLYFPAMCAIKLQLHEWSQSINDFVRSMASKMKENFDKYWNFSNILLAVAVILDPQFKVKLVEYYYHRIYGKSAPEYVKDVYDTLTNLYDEYAGHPTSNLPYEEYGDRVVRRHATESNSDFLYGIPSDFSDTLKGFDEFVSAHSHNQRSKSDLDLYLEEGVTPRYQEFSVLTWWKVNSPKYPILSKMARDILGVPMSAVAFESTFNTRGKILDAYKSSLDAHTVQALICAQDWLLDEFGGSNVSWAQA